MRLLMLSRLVVEELLPSPGVPAPVGMGIKGCRGRVLT